MGYANTGYEHIMASALDLNNTVETQVVWGPGLVTITVLAAILQPNTSTGGVAVVQFFDHQLINDATGRILLDNLTIPAGTGTDQQVFKIGRWQIVPGHELGVHVDVPSGSGDTCRVIIHLTPEWDGPANHTNLLESVT